jgi:aldose 1-epimerase
MPGRQTTLAVGDVTVTVFAEFGGRVGQITVAGQPLLVDVPPLDDPDPLAWGCYPMAPWAGRIRRGRFTFAGAEHHLPINHHDGDGADRAHAIHGLVFDRDWPDVRDVSDTSWTSTRDLDWVFGGTVTQTIELYADRVDLTLSVESSGERFPAEVGWHPWFRKPDRLEFTPASMYRRDEFGLPTGALVQPTTGPWDDCFVNTRPVELHYDRATAATVRVESGCDHWVVFDMPTDATCVEPQSGPPDAFNLTPHVVTPDTPLTRTATISW